MRRCLALLGLLLAGCSDSSIAVPDGGGDHDGAVADGGTDASTDGTTEDADTPPPPPPVCTDDPDTTNARFVIESIAIPRATDPQGIGGFNIDNRNSVDVDVPGCQFVDEPGGVDNAFAYTAALLANLAQVIDENIDLYAEVEAMIENGALSITVDLEHWNGTPNDEAVTVRMAIAAGPISQESEGCGRMVDGVLDGYFPLSIPLGISIDGIGVSMEMRSPRLRLVLSEDGLSIDGAQSYVGGYILWDDGTPTDVSGELKAEVEDLLDYVAGDIPDGVLQTALMTIGSGVDTEGYPELDVCTEIAPGIVSADSFSVAFRVSGSRLAPGD